MRPPLPVQAVFAGAVAGLVAALFFAAAHALIIVPIWDRMTGGLAFGVGAGAVAGWAYHELYGVTAQRVWSAALRGAIFGALLWLTVAPVSLVDAALRFVGFLPRYELAGVVIAVALAITSGAVWGWRGTKRKRGAVAVAAAALALTIAMGGPVPIGRSVWALGIFLAVLPAAIVAGAVVGISQFFTHGDLS